MTKENNDTIRNQLSSLLEDTEFNLDDFLASGKDIIVRLGSRMQDDNDIGLFNADGTIKINLSQEDLAVFLSKCISGSVEGLSDDIDDIKNELHNDRVAVIERAWDRLEELAIKKDKSVLHKCINDSDEMVAQSMKELETEIKNNVMAIVKFTNSKIIPPTELLQHPSKKYAKLEKRSEVALFYYLEGLRFRYLIQLITHEKATGELIVNEAIKFIGDTFGVVMKMDGKTITTTGDTIACLEEWNMSLDKPNKHCDNKFWEKNTVQMISTIEEWKQQIKDNQYIIRLEGK